jgi:hypothetical protein
MKIVAIVEAFAADIAVVVTAAVFVVVFVEEHREAHVILIRDDVIIDIVQDAAHDVDIRAFLFLLHLTVVVVGVADTNVCAVSPTVRSSAPDLVMAPMLLPRSNPRVAATVPAAAAAHVPLVVVPAGVGEAGQAREREPHGYPLGALDL